MELSVPTIVDRRVVFIEAQPTSPRKKLALAPSQLAAGNETGERLAQPRHAAKARWRLLAPYHQPLRKRRARCKAPLLAVTLGDVPVRYVWRFPRAQ
jgi:hypothetical protein